jgi:cold-inducible RNA-binding protein
MSSKLFVGNLEHSVTEQDLRDAFGQFGQVVDATVIQDRETGRSRGFGFIEFSVAEEAERATQELNGTELNGRPINVSAARERTRGGAGPRGGADRGRRNRPVKRW